MLEALLIYSLACYMVYHVVGQSDLLAKPRAWVLRTLPGWLTYPLSCALCFTFWLTLAGNLSGFVQTDLIVLFAAPVVNMVLDLVVRWLVRANEPPVCLPAVLETRSMYAVCGGPVTAGQVVKVENGYIFPTVTTPATADGVKIHPSDPWWKTLGGTKPPVTGYFDGHLIRSTGVNERHAFWAMGAEWPWPSDVGRRVKVTNELAYGPAGEGRITGRTGTISRVGAVTCAWAYWVTPDGGGQDFSASPTDCTFLDVPPFNPLDHEQTK